jgi:peptide/nickel transport system permease protein
VLPFGDPRAIGVGPRLAGPAAHWLAGTDALGRSLLPRVVEAVRNTVLLAAAAVSITVAVSTVVGLLAAYRGGAVDLVVVRAADALFAFPPILLAILAAAIAGPGSAGALASIVLVTLPLMIRVVRASTLTVAGRDFVAAAEVGGASLPRILFVHLLPNIAGPIIVQATYALSVAMLVESGLSFLGLGVQPPDASLGSLVYEGTIYLTIAPWLVFVPGAVLGMAILAVNLLGDGLRDVIDPRAPRVLR